MPVPITRRAWLALTASSAAVAQPSPAIPDLGPRLNSLWSRALGTPGSATLVSRIYYEKIPFLRGWRDERFLTAYLEWADRPEGAYTNDQWLIADVGPYDWILLRRPFHSVKSPRLQVADPIGYTLFKVGPGLQRIPVEESAARNDFFILRGLTTQPIPTVEAAIATSADIVTLYGSGFEGASFSIASEKGAGAILYSSSNQVNARVPSLDRVRLTIDGSATPWVAVSKRR